MADIDKDELEKTLRVFQKEFYNLKEENGNLIFPVFNVLPSKKDYPDYYEIIKRPVSLNTLKKRVPHYTDPQSFLNDIVQIAWNARIYNAPESAIYSYSRIMDKHIRTNIVPKLIQKYPHVVYPNLGPLPEAEDNKEQEKILAKYGTSTVEPPRKKITIKPIHNLEPKEEPEQKRIRRLRIVSKKVEVPMDSALEKENKEPAPAQVPIQIPPQLEQNDLQKQQEELHQQQQLLQQHLSTHDLEPSSVPESIETTQEPELPGMATSDVDQAYSLTQLQQPPVYPASELTQEARSLSQFHQEQSDLPQLQLPIMKHTSNKPVHRGRGRPHKARSPDGSPSGTPGYSYSKSVQPKAHIKRGRPPVIDLPYVQRIKNILKNLKRERDPSKKRWLTAPFERLPIEFQNSNIKKMIPNALSLNDIRKKSKWRKYKNFQSFQEDFAQMFQTFKLFYKSDVNMLRNVSNLETVFANMARTELAKPDRVFLPEGEVRVPFEDVDVNGTTYSIGDWVLIKNPNDETKPTVGQIFRIWGMPDGSKWFNACWYFRPEQTVHRVDRLFYKNEVMKTGQYRDNLVADLLGKCYVVHFTRYQRGDPDMKIEGPLFICEFRYNESDKGFNKIRTWKACLPEELRDQDEPTIPVGTRKFFKYPSPIRQLLPSNATPNDPIPDAVEGVAGGPPLVGAVYLRPPLKRDDLGEYASSPDSPKHIIRPGEPYGEGKIDFEMGTLTLSQSQVGKMSYYQAKKAQAALNAEVNAGRMPAQVHTGFEIGTTNNAAIQLTESITLQKLKQRQLQQLQEQQEQQRQQQMKNRTTNYNFTKIVNNMSPQAAKNALTSVVTDSPGAFTLPISITKDVETLQHSYNTDPKKTLERTIPQKRARGEVVWFKGPSVRIEERFLNLANSGASDFTLNKLFPWNNKNKLDFKEVQEELIEHTRSTRHNRKKEVFEDDEEFKISDEDADNGENNNFVGTYSFGLRPSAKFIAHKLEETKVD
ncbi:chromatin structure-remodeling complex subunit Rsc2p [Monosporozyma servazzii]